MKLKPGLGASYTIQPGNGVGLFYSPGPTQGLNGNFAICIPAYHHKVVIWIDPQKDCDKLKNC